MNRRRRSDHEREVENFYSPPAVFSPDFEVGSVVLPTLASSVEGHGEGVVISMYTDRKLAVARFKDGHLGTIEPCDVVLKGDE